MALKMGIRIGTSLGKNKSWSSYWKTRNDLLLFFGETSKITGGKLYNQVTGATDYLDVAGIAGAETFKIPDSYGAELIGDVNFTGGWWLLGSATIADGLLKFNNTVVGVGCYHADVFEIGKKYIITYEIKNYTSGGVRSYDFTAAGVTRSANGTYTEIFTAGGTYYGLQAAADGTTLNVESITIKEVTPVATYLAADTDNLWYAADGLTNRLVTTDELQRYDWARTIVKYDNTSTYTIRAIAILKDGVSLTEAEENRLRDNFDLSVWWSGVLSAHGNVKENRTAEKSDGTEYVVDGYFVETPTTSWLQDEGVYVGYKNCIFNVASALGTRKTLSTDPFVVGETYRVIFEITEYTSGDIQFKIGWSVTIGTLRSAAGIFIQDIVYAEGNEPGRLDLRAGNGGFVGEIGFFSIRKA